MSASRHYDTVAFDVRDDTSMLFFAKTNQEGDIEDYLLLMRVINDEFGDMIFMEVNEQQHAGGDLIGEAQMSEGLLSLQFTSPVADFDNSDALIVSFEPSAENRQAMEAGVFRVLGEKLSGGHA